MKINKFIKDGKVAVLYSPGYGAGWSTWSTSDEYIRKFLIFDKKLVKMVLDKRYDEISTYLKSCFKENMPYDGGKRDLQVKWLECGTKFRITEYDGYEKIEILSNIDFDEA